MNNRTRVMPIQLDILPNSEDVERRDMLEVLTDMLLRATDLGWH